jgi:hypothetical protein
MPRRSKRRLYACLLGASASLAIAACGWEPSRPFDRESPAVRGAIAELDGGDAHAAAATLEDYLSTGACADGNIGAPELLHRRPNGTFDLGLSLFKIGEAYGRRFGEEEMDGGLGEKELGLRGGQVGCALRVVQAIAADDSVPLDLRARARYLEGNLNFLDAQYEAAVHAYDQALSLSPGEIDAGDPVGRDAAWNRAIALRRIEDKKDAGQDGASDASQDAPRDGSNDSGEGGGDSGKDSGGDSGGGGNDSGRDSGGQDSGGPDATQPPPPKNEPDAAPPPPPSVNQDDRILDQLENAPTVQQEAAKKAAAAHRVRGMADK